MRGHNEEGTIDKGIKRKKNKQVLKHSRIDALLSSNEKI